MHIRRSKPIDSTRLKRDLDKSYSIKKAAEFSNSIAPGFDIGDCPLCMSNSKHLVNVYGFSYAECADCGVVYVKNPPAESALRSAYSSDYYTESNKVLLANDSIIDYRVQEVAAPKVRFVQEHLSTRKMSWLDIGCGVGEVLAAAKVLGFAAHGIETNAMEREYAAKKFMLSISDEYVTSETSAIHFGKYGVISLFSVLEHVLRPADIINTISLMQEAGDNLVIEVPHFPSISSYSQILFPHHINRMLHPPLHLFIFTLESLQRVLIKHGYNVTAAWFFGQDFYELLSTLGEVVQNFNNSILHRALVPMLNDIQKAIDSNGLSDEMLIVAERLS